MSHLFQACIFLEPRVPHRGRKRSLKRLQSLLQLTRENQQIDRAHDVSSLRAQFAHLVVSSMRDENPHCRSEVQVLKIIQNKRAKVRFQARQFFARAGHPPGIQLNTKHRYDSLLHGLILRDQIEPPHEILGQQSLRQLLIALAPGHYRQHHCLHRLAPHLRIQHRRALPVPPRNALLRLGLQNRLARHHLALARQLHRQIKAALRGGDLPGPDVLVRHREPRDLALRGVDPEAVDVAVADDAGRRCIEEGCRGVWGWDVVRSVELKLFHKLAGELAEGKELVGEEDEDVGGSEVDATRDGVADFQRRERNQRLVLHGCHEGTSGARQLRPRPGHRNLPMNDPRRGNPHKLKQTNRQRQKIIIAFHSATPKSNARS
mmetsp:Transcript_2931/g.7658  ORF Transcript_2931/g.7658 Transcript_2931/m.7658 type:complete len:376 (-) Transcript_2931:176-1303(-)